MIRRHRSSRLKSQRLLDWRQDGHPRFEETISMSVDGVDGSIVCYRDVVGLDSDELSILLVRLIDAEISPSLSSLHEQPEC